MCSITLIRHAQSRTNANTKLEEVDTRLTSKGMKQASKLNFTFDLLLLSPLKRTMETYINSNIVTRDVMVIREFRESKDNISSFLQGEEIIYEDKEEFLKRVRNINKTIKKLSKEYNSIGIISHYNVLRELTGNIFDKKISFDNTDYLEFTF